MFIRKESANSFVSFNLYCQFQRFLDTPNSYSYLLRAINAALHLQALILKHHKLSRQETQRLRKFKEILKTVVSFNDLSLEEELKKRKGIEGKLQAFMSQNFYKILRDNSLVPDRHTSEVTVNNHCRILVYRYQNFRA